MARASYEHDSHDEAALEPVIASTGTVVSSDDQSLVERARHGDGVAFEALLASRLEPLLRTARAILGSDADARDATQEACLAAWRKLPHLRDAGAFDAWLNRVLVNACRTALRRRGRIREVSISPVHDRASFSDLDPALFDETEVILRAFDRLNVDHRTVLVLHHLRHQSVASIATALGVPVGTVKSRLHAARAALDAALDGERS